MFDFCLGPGGKYATEFLEGWRGTLVVDGDVPLDNNHGENRMRA